MSSKTTKQPWRKYDAGFKAQVLNKVENGQSIPEVAKELGISEGGIATFCWRNLSGIFFLMSFWGIFHSPDPLEPLFD